MVRKLISNHVWEKTKHLFYKYLSIFAFEKQEIGKT